MRKKNVSSYDAIAGMYHALWADWYLPAALPALERLFFSSLPARARVLDICCGSGHFTKEIVQRGYRVTGVDLSAALIEQAKRDLPTAVFRVQDVRRLHLKSRYQAVISTFDSLNHILTLEELTRVFSHVHRVLDAGGLFVFDMNLEEAYFADLTEWSVDITETSVSMTRGRYDPVTKFAHTELLWFIRVGSDNCWEQHHSTVEQRCYPQADVLLSLRSAGFKRLECIPAPEAGVKAEVGYGRVFFVARA